jgi:hypothetical protein
MKKFVALISSVFLLSFVPDAFADPAHIVAWGDEEGVIKRKGEDLNLKNPALPFLKKSLTELDKKNKIDFFLHVGDFVRFDPNENYYKSFLGEDFLKRFYPTSGGDQEFYMGRYASFINSVPHLKFLYLDRVAQDGNGLEFYYHTIVKDIHIISLYSPDEYREPDDSPQYKGQNFFVRTDNPQYKWLEALLMRVRTFSEDNRPIIVICHGPIFNKSKLLTALFEKYKVNLVLSGDHHVLAHKSYKGTEYFVSGMMGDHLGGCPELNIKEDENFIENYSYCIPEKPVTRSKDIPFKFNNDHYLDIMIDKNYLKIKAIDLETGKEINYSK